MRNTFLIMSDSSVMNATHYVKLKSNSFKMQTGYEVLKLKYIAYTKKNKGAPGKQIWTRMSHLDVIYQTVAIYSAPLRSWGTISANKTKHEFKCHTKCPFHSDQTQSELSRLLTVCDTELDERLLDHLFMSDMTNHKTAKDAWKPSNMLFSCIHLCAFVSSLQYVNKCQ